MISHNDTKIIYSPGNWHIDGSRAKTTCPGAYLRFACDASTDIVLSFDVTGMAGGTPVIKWRIDGSGWTRTPVAATVTIPLPSDNAWDRHAVEVMVASVDEYQPRWSSQAQHVSLTSIDATASRNLIAKTKTVMFFGDSITAGHLAAEYDLGVPGGDSSVTFPYLAAERAGMEAGIIGVGGQGFTTTSPSGIPKLLDAYRYHWSGSVLRDLSADLYVVNMGTNDGGGLTKAIVKAWLDDALPRFTTNAPVLLMRPFGGYGAAALEDAAADYPRVTYVDTTDWWDTDDHTETIHPTGYASIVDFAPRLAPLMLAALGETTPSVYVNSGGVALASRFVSFSAPTPEPVDPFISVFGDAAPPGGYALYTDNGEPIALASTFRRSVGSAIPDNAVIAGGRVWVPSVPPGSTAIKIRLWVDDTNLANEFDREVEVPLDGLTYPQWVDGIFASAYPIPEIFAGYKIGYTFVGNPATYIYSPDFRVGAVAVSPQANGVEVTEGFSTFRSGSGAQGTAGSVDVGYGVDILIAVPEVL